jgi:23S rRNA pseudouridine1911/1915/1917 synthase
VNRLDKDTTGLLVADKTDLAHKRLSEQFAAHGRDGRLEREYLALVWGVPDRRMGVISAPIGRSAANRLKMAVARDDRAREAVTRYQVLETFGKPVVASLLRCRLETGRTHQIRLHLAHMGHPLIGDETYGRGFAASLRKLPASAREMVGKMRRQALHAGVLGFVHPASGEFMRFEQPPPADMAALIEALRRA